jgi:hypothetical protein
MYIMIESIDRTIRYILKYKPFTYLLSFFMAFYMAELYPNSNNSLPRLLGIMFQNQMMRLVMLLSIIYISQYNYYLSSIITIILVGSYMLSDDFIDIPLEGFVSNSKNNNNEPSNNDEPENNDNNDDNEDYNKKDYNNNDEDFIDLDDKLDDDKDKIKEKFTKISLLKNNNKEAKTINECIDLISTLPSDNDNTYKEFLQNISAQRKAYLDMIKNKINDDEIDAAKTQYRKMLKYLTEEFLDKINDDDDDDSDSDDE